MKMYVEKFTIRTRGPFDMVNITGHVAEVVARPGQELPLKEVIDHFLHGPDHELQILTAQLCDPRLHH